MQLLIPFLIYLIAEIYIFVTLGAEIGPLFVIVEVFVTGWIGITILKRTGGQLSSFIRQGLVNVSTLTKIGGARLLSSLLFLLPGILTDAIGAVLFLYSLYSFFGNKSTKPRGHRDGRDNRQGQRDAGASNSRASQETIEGEYTERD